MQTFDGSTILITGGTGSFGQEFVKTVCEQYQPKKIIVFSRDEWKQSEMAHLFKQHKEKVRYFIGDVRDKDRLLRAFNGVDYVVHAAALKQVPALEYNPAEAIKTNINGAMNVINAAIDTGVKKVIALSTDKACNPINVYGATKCCSDKLFIAANSYAGGAGTRFSIVRYGNVFGSRGSVIPFFYEERKKGVLPITDERMTRFWITLEQAVKFVIKGFQRMYGGELFVPKIPSMKIIDLAKAIGPECKTQIIGMRPGEKIHEMMISSDDANYTKELDDCYIIQPSFHWWSNDLHTHGRPVQDGFSYCSNTNTQWLTTDQLKDMLETEKK